MYTTKDTLAFHWALAEIVAEKLAGEGKPVSIRWQSPALNSCAGVTMKTKNGALIDVSTKVTELEKLKIFLHEVAHVRFHWDTLKESKHIPVLPPESVTFTDEQMRKTEIPGEDLQEREAEKQADEWMEFANQNYKKYGNSEIEARLLSLLDWYATDLERQIEELTLVVKTKIYNQELKQRRSK